MMERRFMLSHWRIVTSMPLILKAPLQQQWCLVLLGSLIADVLVYGDLGLRPIIVTRFMLAPFVMLLKLYKRVLVPCLGLVRLLPCKYISIISLVALGQLLLLVM